MSTVITDELAKRHIAANLQRVLRSRGMRQVELARAVDEPETTISRVVRGENMPGAGLLARIAEALETSTDRLMAAPPQEMSRVSA